ncbi:MAG: 2-iminoacetate synthase ThiH [Candidatus Margulisiibacteriota bacterium]
MSFLKLLQSLDLKGVLSKVKQATWEDVLFVLQKDRLTFEDYLILLSEPALERLEDLIQKARALTVRFFGKTILFYVPLYLSNECVNRCVYCGFQAGVAGRRLTLSLEQVAQEAEVLYQKGFRHLLLVSGENRKQVTLEYLKKAVSMLHRKFASISLEIFPLEEWEYRQLLEAGVEGITIYQEVYNRELYQKYHPAGAKANYEFRLLTAERAAQAGFYRINIGALLGLGRWPEEPALLGLHAWYLRKKFWRSHIAISFPRLKLSAAHFSPPFPISDRQIMQLICALRIFLPSAGLVLSTRERPQLRDQLITFGITQISAESRTSPGGYTQGETQTQFEIEDRRSLLEIMESLKKLGYDPVLKDWDREFIA